MADIGFLFFHVFLSDINTREEELFAGAGIRYVLTKISTGYKNFFFLGKAQSKYATKITFTLQLD